MDTKDLDRIITCEEELLGAQRTNDVDALDRLLHADLLFNGPTGETATKAQDLANYRSGGVSLRTVEGSDRRIAIIDGTAVVAVTVLLQGEYMGHALDARYRYLRVWKRSGNDWQVIGGSVVPLP